MCRLLLKNGLNLILLKLICALAFIFVPAGEARETDQYTLSLKPLEDIGPLLSERVYRTLEKVADTINGEILPYASELERLEVSYAAGNLSREDYKGLALDRLHRICRLNAPANIARTFKNEIGAGPLFFSGELEQWVESDEVLEHYTAINENAAVVFSPKLSETVYHISVGAWAPMYILRSPTIRVFDVEFGLDKLGHFMNEGYEYFKVFKENRALGLSVRDSEMKAVRSFGVLTEGGIYGMIITGVYSNADLAAEYAGMKFYRNLTEAVDGGGISYPAIFDVRDNGTLQLSARVSRNKATFFSRFIKPHFNEALNPSLYPLPVRKLIQMNVRERCKAWRDRYPGVDADEFEALTRDLSHWHGEDYGHSEDHDKLVRIGDTCFK